MKTITQTLTYSEPSATQAILRITFAIVLWPHGAQLLLGYFGGPGYTNSMTMFSLFGLPPIISFLVIFLQFFGSLFILAGFLTRLTAVASIILFIGMIVKAHLPFGFFMDWTGTLKGEGFEYHLLVIGILLSLVVNGAGSYSLDNLISRNRPSQAIHQPESILSHVA
jgi:putative oxidoreductase